ncbi:MAG: solute-binding protein [Anaerolineaceae bacterium]|nr:solute-binding protein [Anaerolineaceae bacterium]
MFRIMCVFLFLFLLALAGCTDEAAPQPKAGSAARRVRLATTTSVDNSGLLDELLKPFRKQYNVRVDVIAVGTGKALTLGTNGDVDVLILHDPKGERQFVEAGLGVNRRTFMHSDFLLLGPVDDPAGASSAGLAGDVTKAFAAIATGRRTFVSRGDDSGTHRKERTIWASAGLQPRGRWYLEAGQGMGATLMMADQKQAYVLADRGTYLAFKDKISLAPLCEGDPKLANPYSIVVVNPARWPHVNYTGAMWLVGWVTSREGQKDIAGYRMHGRTLFVPDAVPGIE